VAGRDITDDIPLDIGQPTLPSNIWFNTDTAFDVAIGGQPFIYATSEERPYERATAPYRKQQFDNSQEPGEQSLTGWWIRSQSSFHRGAGIKFYDPSAGEEVEHRFETSKGVNVWTPGQVTLLRDVDVVGNDEGYTPTQIEDSGRAVQSFNSIEWVDNGTKYEGILYGDSYILAKVDEAGVVTSLQNYDPSTEKRIYAIANDGLNAYWIINNNSDQLQLRKKSLNLTSADTGTTMFTDTSVTVVNAAMEFTKERIVAAINNEVYELTPNSTSLPSAVYTHPNTGYVWSSITSSGSAIYVAGFEGVNSSISKFVLGSNGAMPTISSAITAAELPVGEVVYKIKYYLGYMMIGTSKGVRVAQASDDGSLTYGPLIFETNQPIYDFAVRDRFVWCASALTDGTPGLIRIDLSEQISPLVFAYANDVFKSNGNTAPTVACDFVGDTDRLAWVTAAGLSIDVTDKEVTDDVATLTIDPHSFQVGDKVWVTGVDATFDTPFTIGSYVELTAVTTSTVSYALVTSDVAIISATGVVYKTGVGYEEINDELLETGFIQTGRIRYATLEPKNYKRLVGKGDFTSGSMTLNTVDVDGLVYDILSYDSVVGAPEVSTNVPQGPLEFLRYRFDLNRDTVDTATGPVFQGYQIKALPASTRQRLVQLPLFCFDVEQDRFNNENGYQGRAFERIVTLETLEETGDEVTFQDFTTNEQFGCVIEEVSFRKISPPDRRFSGFGGILNVVIRKL
jgi:hypothetical protein